MSDVHSPLAAGKSLYHSPAVKCLRGFIRKILPKGMQNRLSLMPSYISAFGFSNGLKIYFQIALRTHGQVGVMMSGYSYPFFIRAQSADIKIFEEIFVHGIYEIPVVLPSPELIIDGGANIGCACVFFAHKYPDAKIVSVEPEHLNFEILKMNASFYPNISIIQAGIWNKETYLDIKNPAAASSDFQLRESNQSSIRAITIENIRNQEKKESIDILKLDIEGAEKEVFSNPEGWLDRVAFLIMELHEDHGTFDRAIEKYEYIDHSRGPIRMLQMRPCVSAHRPPSGLSHRSDLQSG